ncbi:MAG: hypothetical protein QW771_00280 [Candidatus Micrarchaeia archaeon]
MKGYSNFQIAMGRAVAKNIIQSSDLSELDNELYRFSDAIIKSNDDIPTIVNQLWDKLFKDPSEFPLMKKVFHIILRTNVAIENIPSNKMLSLDYISKILAITYGEMREIENQGKKGKNKEKFSLKSLVKFFHGERKAKILFSYFVGSLKENTDCETKCYNCGMQGRNRSLSNLTLSNKSDYTFEFQRYTICFRCLVYTILSNLYPVPDKNYEIFSKRKRISKKERIIYIYYSIISDEEDITPSFIFYENQFDRFLKYVYLNDNFSRIYIMFFQEGSQAGNTVPISISQFNIFPKLVKMLEKNKNSVLNFKKIFLNELMDLPTYFVSLGDFIQTSYLNKGLIISFIDMYRTNFSKNHKKFYSSFLLKEFRKFVEEYLEVNEMGNNFMAEKKSSSENDRNSKLEALKKGMYFGYRIKESDIYKEDKESSEKYIVSSSAVMELSGKEFIRTIIEITRNYGLGIVQNMNEYIEKIADDEELRLYFILGMLSSIARKKEESVQSEGEKVEGNIN